MKTRVRRKMREYFETCDKEGKRYTLPGLRVAMGADMAYWEALRQDERFALEIELALDRIRDTLEQRGDSMAVMLRKELGSAAAKDKSAPKRLEVSFEGGTGEYGG